MTVSHARRECPRHRGRTIASEDDGREEQSHDHRTAGADLGHERGGEGPTELHRDDAGKDEERGGHTLETTHFVRLGRATHQPRSRHSVRCGRSAPRVVSPPWPG